MAMNYDDAAAERLEAVYLGHDVAAQRAAMLAALTLRPGESVLDIGAGPGFFATMAAEAVGRTGRVRGVDLSEDLLRRAGARNDRPWLDYVVGDATALNEPDDAWDVVISMQVAEYVPDIEAFCREAHRVLRLNGRGLFVATDWSGVVMAARDTGRAARIFKAFEAHCAHPNLPQFFAPRLRAAGFDVTSVWAHPIVNATLCEGAYSDGMITFISGYLRDQQGFDESELIAWRDEMEEMDAAGEYFFLTNRVVFETRKT